MDIRPGMVVRLRSGNSPAMTVERVGSEFVSCQWFDGATLHSATFTVDSLYNARRFEQVLDGRKQIFEMQPDGATYTLVSAEKQQPAPKPAPLDLGRSEVGTDGSRVAAPPNDPLASVSQMGGIDSRK